jgi:DNA-binding NarL/FixJ family response regulator
MQNPLHQNEREVRSVQKTADVSMQEIIRQLARHITYGPVPARVHDAAGQTPEVLLEFDIAGAHYRLLRSWSTSPSSPMILSRREKEIARLIARGYANKTIAAELAISPWTVCTYIRRIFTKIGVGSRAAMVARLLEQGTIQESQKMSQLAQPGRGRRPWKRPTDYSRLKPR